MAYLPLKARSEWMAPADASLGGVVEIMRMFQAAWPASQRPAARPTRGSGLGAVIDTIGVTGGGITAGGGGGGVGRAPGLPRAPWSEGLASPAPGVCAGAACGCCCTASVFFGMSDAVINTTARNPEISVTNLIQLPIQM